MSVMCMAAFRVLNIRIHDSPLVGSLLARFYGHRTTRNSDGVIRLALRMMVYDDVQFFYNDGFAWVGAGAFCWARR